MRERGGVRGGTTNILSSLPLRQLGDLWIRIREGRKGNYFLHPEKEGKQKHDGQYPEGDITES